MLIIHNSLTNKKEKFYSLNSKKINIYVCGPTVYDHLHIGNIRPLIFFDLVKRYFLFLKKKVHLVVNITDIDDKIIQKSINEKKSETEISQKYIEHFFQLLSFLEIETIDDLPLVTNHLPEIISFIKELMKKGYTYNTSKGIYFRSGLISDYGSLSNQKIDKLKHNVRKTNDEQKKNIQDFILWKKTSHGVKYSSPWFSGRPGWHTECVSMIQKFFNDTIDIHGGGNDLKFPHHENEQAQFQAVNKKKIANFFIHVGRVDYQNNKMSKSLGNTVLVNYLLNKFEANIIKLFFLSYHYIQPINYNENLINHFQKKYHKIVYKLNKNNFKLFLFKIENKKLEQFYIDRFIFFMEDDFNTPNVLSLIDELLKEINKSSDLEKLSKLQNTLLYLLKQLSIFINLKEINQEHLKIYNLWEEAKKNKDFEKSDYFRIILQKEQFI
ncbi:cysteinyl-tRNA synthetase [Candidatus Phytoplasma luffae]|uniref:Cysteine--tRNA ligase n=1 Tax=Loofah witches'-broom phytoplasma TaxID=35773 RepID=A0A975ILW5_LOWBP|nr:cysteine--tRNA ligase [Candidatus Phytoplasma luffae]QTX02857.1 cysteinyl-tRNA synthetase [Candidatus Phytoplasma luffae]